VSAHLDLTNRDSELIHIRGSIQSHRAMLIGNPATAVKDDGTAGKTLGDKIGATAAHERRNAAAKAGGSPTAGASRTVKSSGPG
jgi:hypothetical protein